MDASGSPTPRCRKQRHPLGWYSFTLPVDWQIVADTREPNVLRLVLPRGEGSASISVSTSETEPFPPASLSLLRRSLPGMSVIEASAAEGTRCGLRYARRDELLGARRPWYLPWRKPQPLSMLSTACFTRGRIMVVVAIHVQPSHAQRHRAAVDALLRSVRLAAEPVPTPERFVEQLVERARRRYPERRILAAREPLAIEIDGARLALEDVFAELTAGRRRLQKVYAGLLAALPLLRPHGLRLDEVESRLLPAIKPRWWIDRLDRETPPRQRLLRVPFPNDTVVVFAIEHTAALRFVTVDEAQRWELPPRLMLSCARANLARLRPEIPLRAVVDAAGEVRAILLHTGDGHDAARILLPGLRSKLQPHLGDEFVLAIPHRDLLIAFAARSRALRTQVLEHVRRELCAQSHPITDRLFRLGGLWVRSA